MIRYIHRNPVKAGICLKPEDYPYSSFAHYETDPLIVHSLIFGMTGKEEFYRYQLETSEDVCLDIEEHEKRRLTGRQAKALMGKFRCSNVSEFQESGKETQEKILRLLPAPGASFRQVGRLTGATTGIIRKYINAENAHAAKPRTKHMKD